MALLVTLALLSLAMLLAVPPAGAQTNVDYDTDDDRLIEIDSPAKLNAIRHDLGGAGTASHVIYTAAFPTPSSTQCPTSCQGYELTADLDLSTAYPSWTPIGTYTATFDGGGHTISGLTVNVSSGQAGLFATLGGAGVIRNVGLINPSITNSASQTAGALAGVVSSGGNIQTSYVSGGSVTVSGASAEAGGLVGQNAGRIRASYATAAVGHSGNPASVALGGLVGANWGGEIVASYAAAPVTASSGASAIAGGLAGSAGGVSPSITDSYCDSAVMLVSGCLGASVGGVTAAAHPTGDLQSPTGYAGTIYANWNLDLDGDSNTDDDPWDFGTERHYPLLKADKDGDGTATCAEFSGQSCYILPPPPVPPGPPVPPAYHPAHDHPESYYNPRYFMVASCEVGFTWTDAGVTTATLNFHLGLYTRPVTLTLSLWDGVVFRTLQSQGLPMPELRREGRIATVQIATDPTQTRFRLDSEYGLNLVLGYADCHTDDP